ncbi:MAG: hypothetical protein K6F30_04035 [Lachnospiraceae bacterium]|nr:hypothetical protein [Lachnospiraceae bacterium]
MKQKIRKKLSIYFLLSALVITSFAGCSQKSDSSSTTSDTTTEDGEEAPNYSIGLCLSIDNEYYNYITKGFLDAVYDTIGEENVTVDTKFITPEANGESIIQGFLSKDVDLIFANGKAALSAASIHTIDTPVVGAGVIDFKTTLHILDDGWDRYTGRNITGISGSPSVSNQLSLLLETNPTMKHIGILYSPEDTDSIYQNEILENYLDDAGIPWKEYELTSSVSAAAEYIAVTEAAGSVIEPSEKAFASAKEGAADNVESLGEDEIISDILSPNSARSAQISKFWEDETTTDDATKGDASTDETSTDDGTTDNAETVDSTDTSSDEEKDTSKADSSSDTDEESEDDSALEDVDNTSIIETAVSECDALYIAAGSTLTDQIETITNMANAAGISTIGGDMTLGQYTLVTLYSDPYEMGYRAGKLVERILVDGENPGEIKIGLPSSNVTKLYQDTVAELFGMEFPKSFQEYDEFISTYEVGSTITRIQM